MKFTVAREALLKPLQLCAGVVEKRQTMPVLSNVLLELEDSRLTLTGTDLEVELIGHLQVNTEDESGAVTVPAKKLLDICKSLPDGVEIEFTLNAQKLNIRGGRSRFSLSTLPAADFPSVEECLETVEFRCTQQVLKSLIDRTAFAMAHQDVRYYLNGMLFEVKDRQMRTVATDGHRLATSVNTLDQEWDGSAQLIIPRKGVLELSRLLESSNDDLNVVVGSNHIRVKTGDFIFTSKLVDGKFPDYGRVIPKGGDKEVVADRLELRQVFNRIAILSNEKYRGVRVLLNKEQLKVVANNPEQEEAEETLMVDYAGEPLEIGFNVNYLLDALGAIDSEMVKITLTDSNSSALVESNESSDALYVIMPMRM